MENFDVVKINVGYDSFDSNNLPIPNFFDLNLTPIVGLKSFTIDRLLDNTYENFFPSTVDFFHSTNQTFIYPVLLYDSRLFDVETENLLSEKLVSSLKSGRGKIIFFYLTEGYFGTNEKDFFWINNLSEKYGIDKNQIVVVSANLDDDNRDIKKNFQTYKYPFWLNHITFFKSTNKLDMSSKKRFDDYKEFISNNLTSDKKYHYLCFSSEPRIHRLIMYAELMTNPIHEGKFIASLGSTYTDNENEFYLAIDNDVKLSNLKNYSIIRDYYKNYNSLSERTFDRLSLIHSKAAITGTINIRAHQDCFINIVTETLSDLDNCVFFTEKTLKAIYSCQPFIIVGNYHTLKKLKDYGFKTFDKWWNEDYDDEKDFVKRMNKIINLLIDISKMEINECNNVLIEMNEILEHNFKTLCSTTELEKLYSFLNCND
jgi:hypothetical protein